MYQKKKRKIDLERRFSDPKAARGIVVAMFLREAGKSARRRMEKILDLLQRRATLIKVGRGAVWERIGEGAILPESSSPVLPLDQELDQLLAPYKTRLRMTMLPHAPSEAEIAQTLKTMADDGSAVLLLRKCRGCGEPFYATRANQVNCDADCRHIRYAQSDFYKRRARLQSKINYWTAKFRLAGSLAVKAKANERLQTAKADLERLKGDAK